MGQAPQPTRAVGVPVSLQLCPVLPAEGWPLVTAAVFVEAVDTAVRLGWALARRSWGQRAAVGGLRGVPGLPVPTERSWSL